MFYSLCKPNLLSSVRAMEFGDVVVWDLFGYGVNGCGPCGPALPRRLHATSPYTCCPLHHTTPSPLTPTCSDWGHATHYYSGLGWPGLGRPFYNWCWPTILELFVVGLWTCMEGHSMPPGRVGSPEGSLPIGTLTR